MICHHRWISHGGWWRCGECGEPLPRVGSGREAIAAMRAVLRPPLRLVGAQGPGESGDDDQEPGVAHA